MGATCVCTWTASSATQADAVIKSFHGLVIPGGETIPYKVLLRSFRIVLPSRAAGEREIRTLHEIKRSASDPPATTVVIEQSNKIATVATVHPSGFDLLLSRTLSAPTSAPQQQSWQPVRQTSIEGWSFDHGSYVARIGRLNAKSSGVGSLAVVLEVGLISCPTQSTFLLEYAQSILPKDAKISPIVLPQSALQKYGLDGAADLNAEGQGRTSAHTAVQYLQLLRDQGLL